MAKYTLTLDDQIDAGFATEDDAVDHVRNRARAIRCGSSEADERTVLVCGELYVFSPGYPAFNPEYQEPWYKGVYMGTIDRSYFDDEDGKLEFWYEHEVEIAGEIVNVPDHYVGRRAA